MLMKLQKEGKRAASLGAPLACEMSEDHRNRLKGVGLCSRMRFLLGFAVVLIPMQP